MSTQVLLLTLEEASRRLSISTSMVRKITREGKLPVVRIGRAVRYREEDVAALAQNGT